MPYFRSTLNKSHKKALHLVTLKLSISVYQTRQISKLPLYQNPHCIHTTPNQPITPFIHHSLGPRQKPAAILSLSLKRERNLPYLENHPRRRCNSAAVVSLSLAPSPCILNQTRAPLLVLACEKARASRV